MKKTIWLSIGIILIGAILYLANSARNFYNERQGVVIEYNEANADKKGMYNELTVGIKQITQVANANADRYTEVIDIVMSGRADGENLGMKWVQEQNPNANYSEVTKMYENLARFIESKRAGFLSIERKLASINAQHERLLTLFPNNLFSKFFGFTSLGYEPITTSAVKESVKTGVDNDIKLDL